MNFNKDYYNILGVSKENDANQIKKTFYKLSFTHHPDKGGDAVIFNEITEAYNVLMDESRIEYDLKSRFGNNYDETKELLSYDYENPSVGYDNEKLEKDWNQNDLNIIIKVDDTFEGNVEYERWVICKDCKGSGKDTKSKIQIKDELGNILKLFDGSDGCDFCEGTGKDYTGSDCSFCHGKGKVGLNNCKNCNGEKRILGKQKLKGIKLNGKETKLDAMGHHSKNEVGKVGYLLLINIENC
jgi:molecular chaperone DnaJ